MQIFLLAGDAAVPFGVDEQDGQCARVGGHRGQFGTQNGPDDHVHIGDVDLPVAIHIGGIAIEGVVSGIAEDRVDHCVDVSDVDFPVAVHVTTGPQPRVGVSVQTDKRDSQQ